MANGPGKGFLGWLGRQVGHVKTAVKTDVAKKPADKKVDEKAVIYRNDAVEEAPHPQDSKLTLRRTTIDEVIADRDDASKQS